MEKLLFDKYCQNNIKARKQHLRNNFNRYNQIITEDKKQYLEYNYLNTKIYCTEFL